MNITHMQEQSHPLALDGHVIELNTTSFETIDYAALFAQMEHMLHQAAPLLYPDGVKDDEHNKYRQLI